MARRDQRPDETETVRRESVLPPSPVAVGCVLEVRAGPDAGARFVVDGASAGGRVLVGQSPSCEIRLADRTVSRRHAALELEVDGVRLVDLGSRNGTRVNGLRIHDVVLSGGETITMGDTELRVGATTRVSIPTASTQGFGKLLGKSPAMRRLYPICERLAGTDVPVVIEGETGTGKEVLAESIHDAGRRAGGPFIVFDCTTVVASLAEATIFGHERGAFTGAVTSHPGLFEEANGGTLFIDEIGDLDLPLQAKLLRAIERSEVRRVGGNRFTHVDVRILCATRRDLDREVQAGRFRDDLYFRLAVARVELPPLRKREGDIAFLATELWRALGGDPNALTGDFFRKLEAYDWPGNVRQLKNAIARRFALGELGPLQAPGETGAGEQGAGGDAFISRLLERELPFVAARDTMMAEFERRYVERVLAMHGGNVGRAAKASGIGRRYFQTIRGRSSNGEGRGEGEV